MNSDIHLSVVATSRNDNHGGSLTFRMQHFIDGLVSQCVRHQLQAELILVEWNPPVDRPPLREALRFPTKRNFCDVRIITVPSQLHEKMEGSQHLPLYQMIAKNVGIRRARGRFVLATNIDILFSDSLFRFMRDELVRGKLYRANRFDVPSDLPQSDSIEKTLEFCKRSAFRVHRATGSYVRRNGTWRKDAGKHGLTQAILITLNKHFSLQAWWRHAKHRALELLDAKSAAKTTHRNLTLQHRIFFGIRMAFSLARHIALDMVHLVLGLLRIVKAVAWKIYNRIQLHVFHAVPHTNACGDFTLLSREDWAALRGYPEWQMFSWHVDSVLLYQAKYAGINELDLPDRFAIYHIEHGVGSGYTPEGAMTLFDRLEKAGIRYLTWQEFQLIVSDMKAHYKDSRKRLYNEEDWGLASESLHDQSL